MGQEPDDSLDECFIKELRNALNHLYDPDYLRNCAMAELLSVSNRFDTPSVLQGILTRTIEAMKPDPRTTNKSHTQGIYDVLLFRYVQQFQQNEIAHQLGISIRQLRRQQNLAIYELACKLREQYHLEKIPARSASVPLSPESPSVNGELNWLIKPTVQVSTDLSPALVEIQELIQPLANQKKIRLNFPKKTNGLVLAHPVAFQQILLNLLTVVIHHSTGKVVTLKTFSTPEQQIIEVFGKSMQQELSSEEQDWISVIRQLADLCHCRIDILPACSQFRVRADFDAVRQLNVLVVDDNPELIMMMQRFTAETRYRILGVSDPQMAITQALQAKPDLVVLDIMMPQVDGLHLLSHFKHHPALGKLPMIVCSVLPQKFLAISLGASVFIQKPIQREPFMDALNQASLEIEPDRPNEENHG
jgi:CheY-like chemotaxis protein